MTTTVHADELTRQERQLQQRRDALKRANEIRSTRKQMKSRLKQHQLTVHELLDSAEVQTWKVFDLLKRQPKWGPIRTRTVMGALRMRESVRVGDLSKRRRRDLVAVVTMENERLERAARRISPARVVPLRERMAEAGIAA